MPILCVTGGEVRVSDRYFALEVEMPGGVSDLIGSLSLHARVRVGSMRDAERPKEVTGTHLVPIFRQSYD